jgi:hypothetical protein
MKLKTQNNCITISYKYKQNPSALPFKTCFIVKAANVDEEQALKIANILFPDFTDIKVESIENDELTLTYEDYVTLRMMINDKLVDYIKTTKTIYDDISDPIMVKYKKLLEKMTARIGQFPTTFC